MSTLNSGARARAWRRALAATARKPDGTTRTLKFKLDLGDARPFDFARAVALYNITDGVGRGSLTGLLLAAHLNGFRLFMKAGDTDAFRNQACFDDESFRQALSAQGGPDFAAFVPSQIEVCLKAEVRKTGGKDNRFVPEVIANEYARRFTGKPLDPQAAPLAASLFTAIGTDLAWAFGGWQDLKARSLEACAAVDTTLKRLGWTLPSIARMASQKGPLAPDHSTLAFDPKAPQPAGDFSGFEPHVVVALRLRQARSEGLKPEALRKRVQQMVTSDSNAGLSWLFGTGLRYLQTCSPADAARDFNVPQARLPALAAVLDHARAIPDDPLFAQTRYAEFRMLIGGRLDSWVANYLNRLTQLEALLGTAPAPFHLPEDLAGETGAVFFRGTGLDAAELTLLLAKLDVQRQSAQAALLPVLGLAERLPVAEDFAQVEAYSGLLEAVGGVLEMVQNQIRQAQEEGTDAATKELAARCAFKIPDWLAGLPAINRLQGGVPDYEAEVRRAINDFSGVRGAMQRHREDLSAYARTAGKPLDPLARLAAQEAQYLARFKHPGNRTETDPARRALQIVLHRFGNAARQCGEPVMRRVKARYDEWGVFVSPRDSNRYFLNRLGGLFRPVFSKSNHEAYPVNFDRLAGRNVLADLGRLLNELEGAVLGGGSPVQAEVTEFLKLERAYASLLLSGLDLAVPSDLARPRLPAHLAQMPAVLQARLSDATVPADVVQRVFNLYQSVLNGLNVVANRDRFYVRVRFQRVGDTALVYVPRPGTWAAPERLWRTEAPIRKVLEGPAVCFDGEGAGRGVNTTRTVKNLFASGIEFNRATGEYLMQSPHQWAYRLDTRATVSQREGVTLEKSKLAKRVAAHTNAFPLIGPSSFKNVLDRFLTEPGRFSAGDFTLIIDNAFRQQVRFDAAGMPDVQIEDLGYTASVAVPVTETAPASQEGFPLADRYVAIDQGERGIAFAVFDARTGDLQETGTVVVPSIRNLIKAAARYRRRGQPTQKFQQRFDSTLFVMRENVVGDVSHAIINLMRKYKAFPVLEGTVRNLEGGSKQLELVYKTLSGQFLYSETAAHKTARKAYWAGADQWVHPYLMQRERKEGAYTGKIKPLNLFPGASGPTAGTSQACSQCGRNPYEDVRQLKDADVAEVIVQEGGHVDLPSGRIRLMRAPEPWSKEAKACRSRNERSQLTLPITARKLSLADLNAVIRRNLRRPHPSLQSRDTTQSRYHCVYCDCAHTLHADVNAAINIGRRFRGERLG